MIHERWVHVGRDADGEVYVSEGVDLEGMREVRLGDGRRERFRPGPPPSWFDTLTHWVMPSKTTYVTEEGEPAAAPWPPPPWRPLGDVEGIRSALITSAAGKAYVAPAGTPAPAYPRRNIRWATVGTEAAPVVVNFTEPPPSITCPRCGRTSYNPNDIRAGYCGNCHDWTSDG